MSIDPAAPSSMTVLCRENSDTDLVSSGVVGHDSTGSAITVKRMRRQLAEGTTCAMIIDISASDEDITAFYAQLSPDERTSANRFHFRDDHKAYVLTHGGLALLLEALLGRRGPCWQIRRERGGRPVLDLPGGKPMHISLSHSRGMAGIAIGRMAPVGIDVEAHRVIADLGSLAEEVLTETEKLALSGSPAPHVDFFALWVRKEALLKANGLGITVDLRDISVVDVRALKGALADHVPLTLADISTKPDYSSAVCVLADNQSISVIGCEAQRLLGLQQVPGL